jgi:hypothetical protein
MTPDEKLAAILAAVQTDPGNRGLARDPVDNLFTATRGDFQAACRSLHETKNASVAIFTGFIIPSCNPPTHETDGPLGAMFLLQAFHHLEIAATCVSESKCISSMAESLCRTGILENNISTVKSRHNKSNSGHITVRPRHGNFGMTTHNLSIERPGLGSDNRLRTMRGSDITALMNDYNHHFRLIDIAPYDYQTIGIGDGGNEIGMGKIPHETIVKNIPNGDLIHCRVPTDHLIVAGVSNWGAYALAAGIFVLKGITPPDDLFDPDREREILEVMVKAGPLVDGVTGKQEATVDGLTWEEYVKPLVRIRDILAS